MWEPRRAEASAGPVSRRTVPATCKSSLAAGGGSSAFRSRAARSGGLRICGGNVGFVIGFRRDVLRIGICTKIFCRKTFGP